MQNVVNKPAAKRMTVTLRPEWSESLVNLKKTKFYDKPQSELLRYLIELGLERAEEKENLQA
jgi:hypothetical protein